jgi:histidine triad (HIT) family protein
MDCIFCQIAAGTRPAEVVHESRTTIAFLDRHSATRGHTLLVPRRHVPTLLHLPEGAAGSFFAALIEVTERLMETLQPAIVEVRWSQGATDGRDASHFHAGLVPRFRTDLSGMQALGEGEYREHRADIAAIIRGRRADSRRERASRLVPQRIAALGSASGDDDR